MDGRCLGDPCGAGGGGWRPKRDKALLSPQPCTSPGPSKNKNGGRWGPDFREEPRPGGRKSENFGTQGLESGRADTKILALCAGPSTKSESWAVRLSLPMSFSRAL